MQFAQETTSHASPSIPGGAVGVHTHAHPVTPYLRHPRSDQCTVCICRPLHAAMATEWTQHLKPASALYCPLPSPLGILIHASLHACQHYQLGGLVSSAIGQALLFLFLGLHWYPFYLLLSAINLETADCPRILQHTVINSAWSCSTANHHQHWNKVHCHVGHRVDRSGIQAGGSVMCVYLPIFRLPGSPACIILPIHRFCECCLSLR